MALSNKSSSTPPYVLGIDAGTEAVKAALFDLKGNRVATGSSPYQTHFLGPGMAEQDPHEWWQSLVAAVRACLREADVDPGQIIGLSADATTCTLVPMRADGAEIGRALLWMDVRAAEQAKRIFATKHPSLRYSLAGANAEWMPCKMLWLKEHAPEIYTAAEVLLEFTDWIAYRLTRRLTLNFNTITHRWFYHAPSGGWPTDFYTAIGLGDLVSKFPRDILRVGEVVGPLVGDAAEQLGLRAGTPVVTGGGDAFVGLLGQGVVSPGDMGIVMGSSNVLCLMADQEMHFPGIFGSFPDALLPGLNLVEAGQVSTGSILSWFRRNFSQGLEDEAKTKGVSVYQLLDAAAARVPVGAGGLIVLDYFQGNRTPHTDSAARGAIWGLSLQSSTAHIYRALMEGIAYGMRDILEVFVKRGFEVSRIITSGGGTRSPVLMQIYSDVLGRPLYVTREPEASLLGSAILAAAGAGAYPGPAEAAREMVGISGEYQPNLKNHEEYEYYFRSYQQTYPQLASLMSDMSRKLGARIKE